MVIAPRDYKWGDRICWYGDQETFKKYPKDSWRRDRVYNCFINKADAVLATTKITKGEELILPLLPPTGRRSGRRHAFPKPTDKDDPDFPLLYDQYYDDERREHYHEEQAKLERGNADPNSAKYHLWQTRASSPPFSPRKFEAAFVDFSATGQ